MQFVEDPNGQIKARTRHKVPCKVLTVTIQHITDSFVFSQKLRIVGKNFCIFEKIMMSENFFVRSEKILYIRENYDIGKYLVFAEKFLRLKCSWHTYVAKSGKYVQLDNFR
jgi:hypothetical protein